MELHKDKDVFFEILKSISNRINCDIQLLEKDYYSTFIIWNFSQNDNTIATYFEDDILLYKGISNFTRNFDDIKMITEIKKNLDTYDKDNIYFSLLKQVNLEETNIINAVYGYVSIIDSNQSNIFGCSSNIEIEICKLYSESFLKFEISPIIYTEASSKEKIILSKQYNIKPFYINTIDIEHVFINKFINLSRFYQKNMLFETSMNLYDLIFIMNQSNISGVINNSEFIESVLFKYKNKKEVMFAIDHCFNSSLLMKLYSDKKLKETFDLFQKLYVFNKNNIFSYIILIENIKNLEKILKRLYNKI